MVEIEIGVMSQQCLNRRIGDIQTLTEELAAWQRARNDAGATINWMFDVDKARKKLGKVYPQLPTTDVPKEAKEDPRKPPETDVSPPTKGLVHSMGRRPRESAGSGSAWAGILRGRATAALGSMFGRTRSTLARKTMRGAIS